MFTSISRGAVLEAGEVLPLDARVLDDCGNDFNRGNVVVSFSSGETPVALQPAGGGHWLGSWQPGVANTAVDLNLFAWVPGGDSSGTAASRVTVEQGPRLAPTITPNSVVNGASFDRPGSAAPGGVISVFGEHLAPETAVAPGAPLPNNLAATTVRMDGCVDNDPRCILPLYFVSPGQVNALLPFDLDVGSLRRLTVATPHGTSQTVDLFLEVEGVKSNAIEVPVGR